MAKKKTYWTYGELLRKKWSISTTLLTRFVEHGLPAYNDAGSMVHPYDDEAPSSGVDMCRFKLEDIAQFERQHPHIFEMIPTPVKPDAAVSFSGEDELGKRLTATEVAVLMKMNVKKVRSMYKELGGMRLGRNYLFFERRVQDAIQKRTEMDSPSAEGREATGEGVSDKEAGIWLGGPDAAKARKRMEREDRHGLFK